MEYLYFFLLLSSTATTASTALAAAKKVYDLTLNIQYIKLLNINSIFCSGTLYTFYLRLYSIYASYLYEKNIYMDKFYQIQLTRESFIIFNIPMLYRTSYTHILCFHMLTSFHRNSTQLQ